ncbi:MAG TPA: diguanylate cyclase, partial [Dictyoglomaceae bacterium]|nr:diguanylate cyclase [Dictyoglomaceae bacterium]
IILDLDDFKLFNDTYGHIFGDQALKEMANTLKSSCRKVDVIGRYGGDEFTIILPETNSSGCIRVAKRLLEHIQNTSLVTPDGNKISVSVSMGIASYPEDTSDPEKLLSLADTAMYRAKLAGGNQYLTISSEVSQKESEPKFDTFIGLINAIDSKDNYTFKHCRDVAKYACTLGEVLGLSQEDLGILKIAGELHDIGKIGIPPEILKKPGSLNEEEWKIIKEHPRLGFLILNQLPKMEKLLQAVLHHHERYDGKGYPSGLQGADIPLLARILTVADAYSAMKSNRPYRKALSKKEILKELKTNMGKQFDPEIADKFIELLEKGLID